jgi:hypothetical protein
MSGVLLVRAWVHDGKVVARVQSSRPGAEHHEEVAVGDVCIHETLERWLRDLLET